MGVPQDRSRPSPPAEGPSPSEIEMLENEHLSDNAADSQSGHGMSVRQMEDRQQPKKEGRVGMKTNTKGYQKVVDADDECGVWKEGLEEAEEFGLPKAASGRRQLKAMLWRQYLFKKRGWLQTLLELLSPVITMFALVYAYNQTKVEYQPPEVFANQTIPILDGFLDGSLVADSLVDYCQPFSSLGEGISPAQFSQVWEALQQQAAALAMGQPFSIPDTNKALTDALSNSDLPSTPLLLSNLASCIDVMRILGKLRHTYWYYNGPIKVPGFDAFVLTHEVLKAAVQANGGYERLVEAQSKYGNQFGNLLQLGGLAFAPDTSEVARLVQHMNATYQFFGSVYTGTYPSEKAAVDAALGAAGTLKEEEMWAIIVVDKMDLELGDVDYMIRMNYTTVPKSNRIRHKWSHGIHSAYKHYYTSGFLSLQKAVDDYVFANLPAEAQAQPPPEYLPADVWGLPFPVDGYLYNDFYDAVGPLMGLLMCLCTLYPLGMMVKGIVEEKESRAKETMRIMGLKLWVFHASWFVTYLAIFFVVSVLVTAIISSTFLNRSDPLLIFALLFSFTLSLIPFGFFIAVFFSKSKLAAIVAPFAHFAAILPRYIFFRANEDQAIAAKCLAGLLPSTAFTFGIDLLATYEGAFMGLRWDEVADDDFAMSTILLLLLSDFFIYSFFAWYLEQVLPSEYGNRQPLWFPFTKQFWQGDACQDVQKAARLGEEQSTAWADSIERVERSARRVAVQTRGLRKVYAGGRAAVDGLDLTVYDGQITALLGHNGAGKSTTISMLTGLIRPTGGGAHIWGRSIRTRMDAARRVIGVCPQHNVLFNRLTVREHLELFSALKGVPSPEIPEAVSSIVGQLELMDKVDAPAGSLSGGMKRKLQVAIALIGGSKVVFLDEPTSGMDPHSRRAMWELLRKFKDDRAIVLTTHYMDEADILCDRIAILSEGKLRCCGSSLFLKARYGVGYNLTMTRTGVDCDESAVTRLVTHHVPKAVPLSSAGGEMAFQLPLAFKGAFAGLFRELEEKREGLRVGGYGVSMTTLEEVFLRLAQEGDAPHATALPAVEPAVLEPGPPFTEAELTLKQQRLGNGIREYFEEGSSEGVSDMNTENGPSEQSLDRRSSLLKKHLARSISRSQSGLVAASGHVPNGDHAAVQPGERFAHKTGAKEGTTADVSASNGHDEEVTRSYGRGASFDVEEARTKQGFGQKEGRFEGRSFGRAFKELFRKRAIIARRDLKGMANSILLPVAVIAFVLLILKLNIDPAGPSIKLDFSMYSTLIKHGPKQTSIPVTGSDPVTLKDVGGPYLELQDKALLRDSVQMSWELLATMNTYREPRYGALVFNDTVLQGYNFSAIADDASIFVEASLPDTISVPASLSPELGQLLNGTSIPPDSLPPELAQILNGTTTPLDLAQYLNGTSISPDLAQYLNGTSIPAELAQYLNGTSIPPDLAQYLNATAAQTLPSALLNGTTPAGANTFGSVNKSAVIEALQRLREGADQGMGVHVPLTVMHNTSSDHALPALIAELAQARLRAHLDRSDASLRVRSHPLPLTKNEAETIQTFLTVLAALFVLIPFCYLAATFAVFVVRETAVKAKHLQLVSGASVYAYWLSTYAWDLLVYTVIAAITMLVFALYQDTAMVGSVPKALGLWLLLVFFGAAVIPLSYCYAFCFSSHASAQVAIAGVHFITGFAFVVASFVMAAIERTKQLNRVLIHFYRCFPPFNFGEGLINLSKLDFEADFRGKAQNPFKWEVLRRPLLLMLLEAGFYLAVTIAIDRDVFRLIWSWLGGVWRRHLAPHAPRVSASYRHLASQIAPMVFVDSPSGGALKPQEDADVAAERSRVESGAADDDIVLVKNLSKTYVISGQPPKLAVADLCLGIPPGQCFGFLGVNGAGKTTTLSILTGDQKPTSGTGFINGFSVFDQLPDVQRQIGYCPQFDPLLDLMTGREHLRMYARLKGVKEEGLEGSVDKLLDAVGLAKYADKVSGSYSGGNKRKLSLAIALVGDPRAIFLDEPSSGMDPVARRAMWDIISKCTATTGAAVILTTHSMEECEALCGRVGVMVAGKLVCLGSVQHLKSRFGDGYHLEIQAGLKAPGSVPAVKAFVATTFPGGLLEEEHGGRLKYRLPMEGLSLSQVFGAIETKKGELAIDDYSVSQSTLEQVFLSFAKSRDAEPLVVL